MHVDRILVNKVKVVKFDHFVKVSDSTGLIMAKKDNPPISGELKRVPGKRHPELNAGEGTSLIQCLSW